MPVFTNQNIMDKFVLLLILHLTVACNKQIVLYPGQKPPADWTSQLVVVRSPDRGQYAGQPPAL